MRTGEDGAAHRRGSRTEGRASRTRRGGACPGRAPRARLPRTGQEEGAREAVLCLALQMKCFIYTASLQAPGPWGEAGP